jgi:hypothetical protein
MRADRGCSARRWGLSHCTRCFNRCFSSLLASHAWALRRSVVPRVDWCSFVTTVSLGQATLRADAHIARSGSAPLELFVVGPRCGRLFASLGRRTTRASLGVSCGQASLLYARALASRRCLYNLLPREQCSTALLTSLVHSLQQRPRAIAHREVSLTTGKDVAIARLLRVPGQSRCQICTRAVRAAAYDALPCWLAASEGSACKS